MFYVTGRTDNNLTLYCIKVYFSLISINNFKVYNFSAWAKNLKSTDVKIYRIHHNNMKVLGIPSLVQNP